MLVFEIYAPVNTPINWQSELVSDNGQRYSSLQTHLSAVKGITVKPNNWPMGYGSLEHDDLPVFYQPSAVLEIQSLEMEQDIDYARLYIYDDCIAVLNLRLFVSADLADVDDFSISNRVDQLSQKYLSPILTQIYRTSAESPLMNPGAYRFFSSSEEVLTNAKTIWVARVLTKGSKLSSEHYLDWIKNVDAHSDFLQLGSGNSLLTSDEYFLDVHRIMIVSQFHAALMRRVETLLKDNLQLFNANYYIEKGTASLESSLTDLQYRNDHIEYINIQISAAATGVQGRRRELLQQFNRAWGFLEQRERVNQLANLTQVRIDRLLKGMLRQQNRNIQTLLAFLGSLGIVSLVVDLISVENDVSHDDTAGVLDLIQLSSAEHLLGFTVVVVIFLTLYFYRNHE